MIRTQPISLLKLFLLYVNLIRWVWKCKCDFTNNSSTLCHPTRKIHKWEINLLKVLTWTFIIAILLFQEDLNSDWKEVIDIFVVDIFRLGAEMQQASPFVQNCKWIHVFMKLFKLWICSTQCSIVMRFSIWFFFKVAISCRIVGWF